MVTAGYSYVFDLGNVLIRWDPRNLYRKIFGGDAEGMEWFLANVCTQSWNEQHDAGRAIAEGVAELVGRHPQHEVHIRTYYSRWEEMLGGSIDENVAVLQELKGRGTPVYALSNWSAETFPIAEGRFPFLRLFDGIVLSGRERLIKPDPRIYRTLLDRYGLEARRTVFIDDSKTNVAAAAALGIVAVHCELGSDLRTLLASAGVAP
jgi:HAD superfamily hydrolase (TIGR01509 family)